MKPMDLIKAGSTGEVVTSWQEWEQFNLDHPQRGNGEAVVAKYTKSVDYEIDWSNKTPAYKYGKESTLYCLFLELTPCKGLYEPIVSKECWERYNVGDVINEPQVTLRVSRDGVFYISLPQES